MTILTQLVDKDKHIGDVEFVVNMHDYNKLLRHPNQTLAWRPPSACAPQEAARPRGPEAQQAQPRTCQPLPGLTHDPDPR